MRNHNDGRPPKRMRNVPPRRPRADDSGTEFHNDNDMEDDDDVLMAENATTAEADVTEAPARAAGEGLRGVAGGNSEGSGRRS